MLWSTPQSEFSEMVSESMDAPGVRVNDIYPWIARDVEKCIHCSFGDMLNVLLEDCLDERASLDMVLNNAREQIIQICNGKFERHGKGLEVKSSEIKEYLNDYSCSCKTEAQLYRSFVRAVNTALLCLDFVNVQGLRGPADTPLCFHINGPSLLRQTQQDGLSERNTDVVSVSREDARNTPGEEMDTVELLHEVATMKPGANVVSDENPTDAGDRSRAEKCFDWRSVHTFVGFKTLRHKMAVPPESYTWKPYHPPPAKREYLAVAPHIEAPAVPPSETILDTLTMSGEKSQSTVRQPGKRPTDGAQPEPKRQKLESRRSDPAIIQAGTYAAELFAAHVARQHVIGMIVADDLLYVWRYDRQGMIQCSGLNFIEDLPRFLLLLLAMQRFQNHHWGLNPQIDSNFGPRQQQSPPMTFQGRQGKEITITLDLSSNERRTHFGVAGRATNTFPATITTGAEASNEGGLIAKVFWAEESRVSEPKILEKVYEIAQREEDVKDHVPVIVCHHKYEETATKLIRERLTIDPSGSRVLYVVVFLKLEPITDLSGDTFLRVWWETVKCHLALWKNGVRHRDISPSNVMYRKVGDKMLGVLNDYDLASIGDDPTGTERTGTIPFMALDLLEEDGLMGKIPHAYEYDAESFIWALTFITLRYENGKPRKTDRPLDEWLTVDAATCRDNKLDFLFTRARRGLVPGAGHQQNYEVAHQCLDALLIRKAAAIIAGLMDPRLDVDSAFEELLADNVEKFLASRETK